MLSVFSCVCWPSVCLFWENVYSGAVSFFNWVCLVDVEVYEFRIVCLLTIYRYREHTGGCQRGEESGDE